MTITVTDIFQSSKKKRISKCVNLLLFQLLKLSEFLKMCFTTTKQTGLVQFNLAKIVLCSGVYHFIQIIPTTNCLKTFFLSGSVCAQKT